MASQKNNKPNRQFKNSFYENIEIQPSTPTTPQNYARNSTKIFIPIEDVFDKLTVVESETDDDSFDDDYYSLDAQDVNHLQILSSSCIFVPVISKACLDDLQKLKDGFEHEGFFVWQMALEMSNAHDITIIPFFVGGDSHSYQQFSDFKLLKSLPEVCALFSVDLTVKDVIMGLLVERSPNACTAQITGFMYDPETIHQVSHDIYDSLINEHMDKYSDLWSEQCELIAWHQYQSSKHNYKSQLALAKVYEVGLYGIMKSPNTSYGLYKNIAESLFPIQPPHPLFAAAACNLALCLFYGKGVTKDQVAAIPWFLRAGELGDSKAALHLGECFLNGVAVRRHETEAVKWFSLATSKNEPIAMNNLATCYRYGIGTHEDLSMAFSLFEKAAKVHAFVPAMYNLALLLEEGKGTDSGQPDYELAFSWYQRAAIPDNGRNPDIRAITALGRLYQHGQGVSKDVGKAIEMYKQAGLSKDIKNVDPSALYHIGDCFLNGEGVEKDISYAMKWFEKAAALNQPDAICALGEIYEQGNGDQQNFERAISQYRKAMALGSSAGKYHLALCYLAKMPGTQDILAFQNSSLMPPPTISSYQPPTFESNRRASETAGLLLEPRHQERLRKSMSWLVFGKKEQSTKVENLIHQKNALVAPEIADPRDKLAVQLLTEAGNAGNAKACYELGKIYRVGSAGVVKDRMVAIGWFRKAVEGGDKSAEFALASWFAKRLNFQYLELETVLKCDLANY
ncbi:hypothetical protein HK096_001941 [Nowakowskiella sp. JEL0078]|nr:hypothetical protein HK096_001941 [Nowakowskiella sp. JEL0078]